VNQSPTQVRIAIVEDTTEATAGSLGEPLRRAATVVGVQDRVQCWNSDDLAETSDLDLLVFSQRTPAEWSPATTARWRRRFPLARQVVVWGPWCVGGHRHGFPDPGIIYVSWLSWPWQIQCFLRQYFGNERTLWDLPATRSAADRLARASLAMESDLSKQATLAAGATSRNQMDLVPSASGVGTALVEACAIMGWNPRVWTDVLDLVRASDTQRAPVWIWEPEVPRDRLDAILQVRQQLRGPGIVLLGYAEILAAVGDDGLNRDFNQALSAMEATVLLPKPFLFAELQAAVGDLRFQNGARSEGLQSLHDIDHQ